MIAVVHCEPKENRREVATPPLLISRADLMYAAPRYSVKRSAFCCGTSRFKTVLVSNMLIRFTVLVDMYARHRKYGDAYPQKRHQTPLCIHTQLTPANAHSCREKRHHIKQDRGTIPHPLRAQIHAITLSSVLHTLKTLLHNRLQHS